MAAEHTVAAKVALRIPEEDHLDSLGAAVLDTPEAVDLGNPGAAVPDSPEEGVDWDKVAATVPGILAAEVGWGIAEADTAGAADLGSLEEAALEEHIGLGVAALEGVDIGLGEAALGRHTGLAAVASIAADQVDIVLGCEAGQPGREVAVDIPDSSRLEEAGLQVAAHREVAGDSFRR